MLGAGAVGVGVGHVMGREHLTGGLKVLGGKVGAGL